MSPEIILIAGLPGSGKTMYMNALRQKGSSIFDDFKASAYNDSPVFWHSQNYKALLMALREGQKCVVADIDFCKATSRHEAGEALREQIPDLTLNWLFFENDFPPAKPTSSGGPADRLKITCEHSTSIVRCTRFRSARR